MISKTEEEIMRNWDQNKPLVTIRCLAYNHEKYIEQCLNGFFMQETNFPFEVVIHDDCSTDNTKKIIEKYAEKYPSIIIPIYENENQFSKGAGALNGIINKYMHGKYIAVCEGDDYWTNPCKLQKQFDAMEARPECSIAFNVVEFVDVEGNPIGKTAPPRKVMERGTNIFTLEDYINTEYKSGKWAVHTSSFFVRTDIFHEYTKHRFAEYKVFPYGDMAIVIYMLSHGCGYIVPEVMGCYRRFSGGYNSYIRNDAEYAIKQERRLIEAIEFVDKLTGGIYSEQIWCRKYRAQMLIAKKQRNKREFLRIASISNISKAYNTNKMRAYRLMQSFFLRIFAPGVVELKDICFKR